MESALTCQTNTRVDSLDGLLADMILKQHRGEHDTLSGTAQDRVDTVNVTWRKLDLTGMRDWIDSALKRLDEVYNECSEPNWDGYGGEPISHEAYVEAQKLLRMIPPSFPKPEILAEPSGEIAFEWYKDNYSVFVISIGGNNIITYAGLFGTTTKTHGTESFADKLPKLIFENIRRVFA